MLKIEFTKQIRSLPTSDAKVIVPESAWLGVYYFYVININFKYLYSIGVKQFNPAATPSSRISYMLNTGY